MFQFTPLAPPELYIHPGVMRHDPHRVAPFGILGSKVVCTSPRLIAAYHVLHRLSVPRHPPFALISLTKTSFQQITTVLCKESILQFGEFIPNSYSIVKEQLQIL